MTLACCSIKLPIKAIQDQGANTIFLTHFPQFPEHHENNNCAVKSSTLVWSMLAVLLTCCRLFLNSSSTERREPQPPGKQTFDLPLSVVLNFTPCLLDYVSPTSDSRVMKEPCGDGPRTIWQRGLLGDVALST